MIIKKFHGNPRTVIRKVISISKQDAKRNAKKIAHGIKPMVYKYQII